MTAPGPDGLRVPTRAVCAECGRVFDLLTVEGSAEWFGGHDCEPDAEGMPS